MMQNSILPASIASRLRLWLKSRKSQKEPTALRWQIRVIDGELGEFPFPPHFFKTDGHICFDIAEGDIIKAWMELPEDFIENTSLLGKRDTPRYIVSHEIAGFDKILWLGDSITDNYTWRRALGAKSGLISLTGLATSKFTVFIPGILEIATILGVTRSCIVECRSRVLFIDSSKSNWFLVEMPQVVYLLLDAGIWGGLPDNGSQRVPLIEERKVK